MTEVTEENLRGRVCDAGRKEQSFDRHNMGKGTALAKASWQVRAIPVGIWGTS